MAKKKDEEEKTNLPKHLQIIADLEKKFGKGSAVSAGEYLNDKSRIIPVSPALDIALNGGIPEGSWCLFGGKPKVGKTSLALHVAANAQKPENGGKHVYYLNIEGRLKEMNLNSVKGLNRDKFTVIKSTEDHIMNSADFLQTGENILMGDKGCVLIIDSYSCLANEKELTEGVGASMMGRGNMLLAQFCRNMSTVVPIKKSIVIGITHIMANVSGYGSAFSEKGGNAIQYQVDVKLRVKNIEAWEDNEKKRIGQKVNWVVDCSALGGAPGQEVESYIRYGEGIDEIRELIEIGTGFGFIDKAGAWYTMPYLEDKDAQKFQGEHKLYAAIAENKEWENKLRQKIKEVLN